MKTESIRIFRKHSPVSVLGPGKRAVIWVQGCTFRCPGCIVPESWAAEAGHEESVDAILAWILAQKDIQGVTYSGGEPMEQARPLCLLTDYLRARSSLDLLCYTGYRMEHLLNNGSADQKRLMEQVDLLIDGAYQQSLHANLLWRGSSNQRLIAQSERHRKLIEELNEQTDVSAGMEFHINDDAALAFSGVPANAGFRDTFEKRLADRGIVLAP